MNACVNDDACIGCGLCTNIAPAVFELNKTIPCWQQGLQTVPVGSKVKLVCPPSTAYGANQVGNIPPNSTLTYEIDLLEVSN